MEIIVISDSKLKLMLAKEDLATFGLNVEQLDYGKIESKRVLRGILKYLREHVGFQTDGYRVLVQLFPSRDGGCELFITRIAELTSSEIEIGAEPAGNHWEIESIPDGSLSNANKTGAFSFERLEWLISVCRHLSKIGYTGTSDAYISDDHRYYLFLRGMDAYGYLPLDEFSFIAEYGRPENTEMLWDFLCEHGTRLCLNDAVAQLSVL